MLRPPLLFALALILSAVTPALRAAEEDSPSLITASDLLNLKQVEAPMLSPDGRWVVYIVRSIETMPAAPSFAKASEGRRDDWVYRTQLWLAATDGRSAPRQLSFGTATNASPVWSPAGDRLAFVRTLDKGKPQIHVLALAGGESWPLTKLPTGASQPAWSPDGKKILFSSPLSPAQVRAALEQRHKDSLPPWSSEKPGRKPNDIANWAARKDEAKDQAKSSPQPSDATKAQPDGTLQEIREWLAQNETDAHPRVTDRLNFLAEGDLALEPTFNQLYTIEAREGAEPTAITLGYASYADSQWLADGQSVVCTGPRHLAEHPDRSRLNSIYRLEVATGQATVLLAEPDCNYQDPRPSPDGQWIAFTRTPGGEYSFEQPMVAILPVAGGPVTTLTAQLDRAATNLKWAPDSASIYFVAASRGHFPLHRVSITDPKVQILTVANEWGIREFAVAGNTLVQVVTHPGNPWELYYGPSDGQQPQPLTTHNSSWLKNRRLSAYEPHSLVTKDGLTVDYWTLKPANFDAAKKYPLLVNIHGGPSAMWGSGEATTWHEMQFFAARGYAIVFCNPRGSGGYGRDFQRANWRDWGMGPMSDVLAAADFAAKGPYVDTQRQVVTGGSYGGYLTAWIVAHDHRFSAAIAQRGVYDLATFHGEGNAWRLLPMYFGGFPWQKDIRPILDRESPLTYVENIKTPLLIKHGDVDFRTGIVQSQLLYKSLKQLGRPVEYVRYPQANHELSRSGEPRQRLDRLVRFDEFFRRYIGEN